ncbi:unnamed protein product [Closterium sp. Naga37s-1]|nr:unnamed protein product [Closterium sp. Naga37s-1]
MCHHRLHFTRRLHLTFASFAHRAEHPGVEAVEISHADDEKKPTDEESTPLVDASPGTPSSRALANTTPTTIGGIVRQYIVRAEFGGLILYYFICDRTDIFGESTKHYSRDLFIFLYALLVLTCFFTSLTKHTGASLATGKSHPIPQPPPDGGVEGMDAGAVPPTHHVNSPLLPFPLPLPLPPLPLPLPLPPLPLPSFLLSPPSHPLNTPSKWIIFLMYHYWEAREIYNSIRLFIAAYVWMTGFGNFSYYYVRKDFGLGRFCQVKTLPTLPTLPFPHCHPLPAPRPCPLCPPAVPAVPTASWHVLSSPTPCLSVPLPCIPPHTPPPPLPPSPPLFLTPFFPPGPPLPPIPVATLPCARHTPSPPFQMMWRLNFLVFFCCLALTNDYMLYYICPMHTLFTVMVYAALGIYSKYNELPAVIGMKIAICFVVVFLLWEVQGVFELVWGPFTFLMGYIDPRKPDLPLLHEWHFRSGLDRYIWIIGMIYAYFHPMVERWLEKLEEMHHMTRNAIRAAIVAVCLSVGYVCIYIALRNLTQPLRNWSLALFGWLGKITLETYIGQFHIWLRTGMPNGQPAMLLSFVRDYPPRQLHALHCHLHPHLNHKLTPLKLVSLRLFELTNTLKNSFVPHKDNTKLGANTVAGNHLHGRHLRLCRAAAARHPPAGQ